MIAHFEKLPGVVGIVEYGSRPHTNMWPGGDYDLTVIFDKPVSQNFSGVHFYVAGIPVDCMLLCVDDFATPVPQSPFHLVHLDTKILYDKDGITRAIFEDIGNKWRELPILNDNRKMWIRFITKHTIDKLEHRLYDDEMYSRYIIASTASYAVDTYAVLSNLEPGKTKIHFARMKQYDSTLYGFIEKLHKTTKLSSQFGMLKEINDYIAKNVGGMWNDNEALFHLTPDGVNDESEQELFKNFLFG